MAEVEIKAVKDEENEHPIPSAWRPVFRCIVNAFAAHDYLLGSGIQGVDSVSNETAEQIKEYIQDYGEELVELADGTWESSICIWMGNQWEVLIDLWTAAEGSSDLMLSAWVSEKDGGYLFHVYMVYVP